MVMQQLMEFLSNPEKLVILLIGNTLRRDDGIAMALYKDLKREAEKYEKVHVIACGEVPENFTSVLRELKPSHVLLIDAVDFGAKPGDLAFFTPDQLSSISLSSHRMSLRVLSRFIEETIGAKVALVGIQPKNLEFGFKLSAEVREAGEKLVEILAEVFRKRF